MTQFAENSVQKVGQTDLKLHKCPKSTSAAKAEWHKRHKMPQKSEKSAPFTSVIFTHSAVKKGEEPENPTGYAEFPVAAQKI